MAEGASCGMVSTWRYQQNKREKCQVIEAVLHTCVDRSHWRWSVKEAVWHNAPLIPAYRSNSSNSSAESRSMQGCNNLPQGPPQGNIVCGSFRFDQFLPALCELCSVKFHMPQCTIESCRGQNFGPQSGPGPLCSWARKSLTHPENQKKKKCAWTQWKVRS